MLLGFLLKVAVVIHLYGKLSARIFKQESTYLIGLLLTTGAFLLHRANYALGLIREKDTPPLTILYTFISTNHGFFPLKSIHWVFLPYSCRLRTVYFLPQSNRGERHLTQPSSQAWESPQFISCGTCLCSGSECIVFGR